MEVKQFGVSMSPHAGDMLCQTLYSGYIGQGPVVAEFEQSLSKWLGGSPLLAVNSGTAALHLAVHVTPRKSGIVFTTPLTCFATTAAILTAGRQPFWIDISPHDCNIDLACLKESLTTHQPDAIVVVHYAGYPVNTLKLRQIAGDIPVIEDCAHAMGSSIGGRYVGNGDYGNIGCFSFQAIKTLTTGDGGGLVLSDPILRERIRKLRWFGLERNQPRESQNIREAGFKYHMNDLAASIGLANLQHLESNLYKQQKNVEFYRSQLPQYSPFYQDGFQTSGWMFPIIVEDAVSFNRAMHSRGIQTGLGHERNDLHECVKLNVVKNLPGLEETIKTVSCIPSGCWLKPEEREYVVDCIKQGW
jgi:dTDP-4-amino-4,6-dideoxygalactose transaminase